MNTINKRLLDDLFTKKHTNFDSEIYNQLYDVIWPCENEYVKFLKAKDSSVKIDCAKKIFEFYNSNYDLIFPDFFIEELISLQQKDLKTTEKYIPQDHFVHSVNLYILGIYSFFNIEVFHRKLLQVYTNENYINKHKLFIKEWTLFALYHDIGYVIESNVNSDGKITDTKIIEKYQQLNTVLLKKQVIQTVAKLITIIHVINQDNYPFSVDKDLINNFQWVFNSQIMSTDQLFSKLNMFTEYNELQSINCDNDRFLVDWILENKDYLVVYRNKSFIPVVFVFVNKNGGKEIVYNNSVKCRYENFINSIIFDEPVYQDSNILCSYYVIGIKERILASTPTMFHFEIFDYYQCLPQSLKNKISLSSNPNLLEHTYKTIYQWLKNAINKYEEKSTYKHKQKATIDAIQTIFQKNIHKYIWNVCEQKISTCQKINKLGNILSEISPEEVDELIRINYNKEIGICTPILNFYMYLFNLCKKKTFNYKSCICADKENISFQPFVYEEKNYITRTICEKLVAYSEQLNIDFCDLQNYKTDYTACDHGLVSSSLLLDIIAFNEEFIRLLSENSMLCLAYHDINIAKTLTSNNAIDSYSRIIFSILLHNIYVKESCPYGIDFVHNIDVNAFAYFGALMDSLQRWGRPKQRDFSVLSLPEEHFLEDDYDISFTNSNIIINCLSSSSGNMRNYINSLESFLPGIASIVKVHEFEE